MPLLKGVGGEPLSKLFFVLSFCGFLFLCATCQMRPRRSFLPNIPGYDESKKEEFILDKKLVEISGMYYLPDGRIAANNDEEGKVFFLKLPEGSLEHFKFGGKGDYEDLVQVDSFFYVLESNGNLHKVLESDESAHEEFKFPKKKIEFESLYYDKPVNKLVLISKDHSETAPGILAYSFDLADHAYSDSEYYFIPMKQVFRALKNNIAECKPSAAAINPVTGKVFIIASVGKVLLVCTRTGTVEHAYKINPSQFPQPEGITFAPNGDMYISNEGANGKA